MRLSKWRASSPNKSAGAAKVAAVVDPVLQALGSEPDPECWVAWGDDPAIRYTIFVPTPAGLIASYVRINLAGEGPRATAKLIRWSRVQLGELAIETQGAHRLVSFQVEQNVLQGADDKADLISRFALGLMASVDGRELPPAPASTRRPAARKPAGSARKSGAGRPAGAAGGSRPAAPSARPGSVTTVQSRTRGTAPSR